VNQAGVLLRDARARAGLSQRALAERAGTSQARISRIENSREDPSVQTLDRLVRACGRTLVLRSKERLRPNRSDAALRRAYRQTTAVQPILDAAELARALGVIASAGRGGTPLQPLELLGLLVDHQVEFVVIGGFALAPYGFVRATDDLDVVPRPEAQNLERLATACRALEARPVEEGDFRGGSWMLSTAFGTLHLMQTIEGVRNYDDLRARAQSFEIPEVGSVVFSSR
jgi:transcriptional regulator with XRE-family HTH domain